MIFVICHNYIYFIFLETPPIEYWQKLAEQRRIALLEALTENEQVRQ